MFQNSIVNILRNHWPLTHLHRAYWTVVIFTVLFRLLILSNYFDDENHATDYHTIWLFKPFIFL